MLKSTYKPSKTPLPPLPPGWTEHKAPTGHAYYYNESTKTSTYTRPGLETTPAPHPNPVASFQQYSSIPNLSDPSVANAWQTQYNPQAQRQNQRGHFGGGRGGHHGGGEGHVRDRPRPQPKDKPRSKFPIPGCEPWILVYTKYGRRFAYNPVKNASYWRIPEKVMQGVLELDIQGIKDKADGKSSDPKGTEKETTASAPAEQEEQEELGSDYEEVEVTDDEGGNEAHDADGEEQPSKRQRTEVPDHEQQDQEMPVEFNEDDIAYQLQAMGEEYGLDPGEYDDGNPEDWPEGAEGIAVSDNDARELFKDLLNNYGISPYSPWEKLIEDSKIIDDPRYTILPNMKARREVWDEWSREQIAVLKERRAKEEKTDPRIPYMAFLQEKATPKLYWPEFRRKYKKEGPMRDTSLLDKEREKLYREYIARLKMPRETLKKDLTALLKSIPAKDLNNKTLIENLPPSLLADVRFISLDSKIRDQWVEGYISTLGPPPEAGEVVEDQASVRSREERTKREKALAEREREVAEEKRRQQRQLARGRAVLREEERELERAMHVDKRGLQSQLLATRDKQLEDGAK